MSLIYVINISKLSARVTLEFNDFIMLYTYVLPDIIFSTLPLTFLGAVINSLSNLSESNEAIAMFSVGFKPQRVLRFLLPSAMLFTTIITILAIFITPYTTQKMKNYRSKKIYESKLKILPKKLSQNFGSHHIFIDENKNGKFKNVTMFTECKSGHVQIMLAQDGFIKNETNSSSYLSLNDGMIYRYKNIDFNIIDFSNLKLYNNSKYYSSKILSTKEYWLKHSGKFYYYLLISLSPILLIILYVSFGIYNPRYQKNRAAVYILISVLLIYIPAIVTRKLDNPYVVAAVFATWLVLSVVTFKNKISKRY
jgi:lipopolysaccharide export system permease protein